MKRVSISHENRRYSIIFVAFLVFITPIILNSIPKTEMIGNSAVWWDEDWNYRVKVIVWEKNDWDTSSIAEGKIDFTFLFSRLGADWLTLDFNSLRIIEYYLDGTISDHYVPFRFIRDEDYNPRRYARGNLMWKVKKKQNSAGKRLYYIYFDAKENGLKPRVLDNFPYFGLDMDENYRNEKPSRDIMPEYVFARPNPDPRSITLVRNSGKLSEVDFTFSFACEKFGSAKFPEIRGIWYHDLGDRYNLSRQKITEDISLLKSTGFNAIFVWISNLYAEALRNPGLYGNEIPHSLWDSLSFLMEEARSRNIKVHLWYSINNHKEPYRATELRLHPDWASINRDLLPVSGGIDLSVADARYYEKELVLYLVDRYQPDGFHFEEPYYQYAEPINISYTNEFRKIVQTRFGFDPLLRHKDEVLAQAMASTKLEIFSNFFHNLKKILNRQNPGVMLSANGPFLGNKKQGFDAIRWAESGYLDFYVPQIYTDDVQLYKNDLKEVLGKLSDHLHVYIGTAMKWSAYDGWNAKKSLETETKLAQLLGANGIVFFTFGHLIKSPDFDAFKTIGSIPLNHELINGFIIKGKVLTNRKPISGARVRTKGQEAITDKEGRYVVHSKAGECTIEVHFEGAKIFEDNLIVHGNTILDLDCGRMSKGDIYRSALEKH
jgi:uncharacterized lipoprotein YddW (UPF0748 family)